MLVIDTVTLGDQRRTTKDGYLVVDARVARTGIQIYAGHEVGRPDMATVRVYRSPEEVFSDEARASFAHKPVTVDHPAEPVTSGNWSKFAKGYTGDTVQKDGDYLRVPFALMDQAAIDQVSAGKRELSNGYSCDLDWTPGKTPAGEAYDAAQRNIRGNHLAIVDAARAGPACRIGDSFASDTHIEKERVMTLKTVTVDGIPVEVTDQGATVIATLQTRLGDAKASNEKLVADHSAAIESKDADLAKKDAEIDALKAKVLDDAALDARVQARADLIAAAKAIAPTLDTAGKSDADIRRAVVIAKVGDAAIANKPAAYVDARFDILAEEAKTVDPVRDALRDSAPKPGNWMTADQAYAGMLERDANAWKGAQKETH